MNFLTNKKEIFVWIFLVTLLIFRVFVTRPVYKAGNYVRISQRVTSEPTIYEKTQGIKLAGVYIYLPKYPEINYYDFLVVEGQIVLKNNALRLDEPKIIKHIKNKGLLIKIRQRVLNFYQKSLPAPYSSLVSGMVIGSKSLIASGFWEILKKSGTAHVVVASGMNITLVSGFVMGTLILAISRKKAAVVSILVIWIYAVIAGFDAPIIRAAIMASLLLTSQIFGKVAIGIRALIITGLTMLLIKPDWAYDLGFLLSFTATLSLMIFTKPFEKVFRWLPKILKEGFVTSFAAQIGVAPILLYTFGYINILSPVINAIVLWVVPVITIMGMVSALVVFIYEPLAYLTLILSYPFLYWFNMVVSFFGK